MSQHAPLPATVAELQALVLEQQASLANMVREIAARDDEIERLKAQIDKLRRMYFGSKSEKLARQIDKLEAQLEDLTAGHGAAEARGQRDKHRRDHLIEGPRENHCRRTCRATRSNSHLIRLAPYARLQCSGSARMSLSNSPAWRPRSK